MRTRAIFVLLATVLIVNVSALEALAVQVPRPSSSLFIQTSGPNAGLGIGDYYTSPAGGNTDHLFVIRVPSNWPAGTPVTVALYDPELAGPNPASPTAADEIRNGADSAVFTLVSPTGATLETSTYSDASTNGAWSELTTFDPGASGTGNYLLRVSVSDDDDNSWRVDASHDPDCTVGGGCADADLVNGNEVARAPSGSSSLAVGVIRTSWQHAGSGSSCQDHYFFVNSATARPLRAHNFDMDGNGSVTYTAPNGSTIAGTVSTNGAWNNSPDANRVGDVLPDMDGWWRATVCINSTNQYVFESPSAGPSFPEPQPAPRLVVSKSDGVDTVRIGDQLTYTITIDNVSDEDSLPGEAFDVTATDTLPAGLSFVSCSSSTMTCSEADGVVSADLSGELDPGDVVTFEVVADVTSDVDLSVENEVQVAYEDHIGSAHAPTTASDVDDVEFEPELTMAVSGPVEVLRGDPAGLTYTLTHDSDGDLSPVASPVVSCSLCSSISYVSGDTNTDGVLDSDESWVYEAVVATGPSDSDVIYPEAVAVGTDRDGDHVSASAEGTVVVTEPASLSGVVFEDLNGNGLLDSGEPGLGSVGVTLEGTGEQDSGSEGAYAFEHLAPAGYTVSVADSPEGMTSTSPLSLDVDLDEGEDHDSANFGFARPALVSGTVYVDEDLDGAMDAGEVGLAGATVELLDDGGEVVDEVVTDTDGNYSFSVLPGEFQLRLATGIPSGWIATTLVIDSTGLVLSGGESADHDFGVGNQAPTMPVSDQSIELGGTPEPLNASDPEGMTVTYSLVGGILPAGLTLEADGSFSGAAVATGVYQIIVQVCDTAEPWACAEFDVVIQVLSSEVLVVDELPFTGAESVNLVAVAAALLVVGSGTLLGGRSLWRESD